MDVVLRFLDLYINIILFYVCFALLYLLDPVGVVVDDVEGSAISTSVDCITYILLYALCILFNIVCVFVVGIFYILY